MKALVVLSGGQDSTTCLYVAKAFVNYEEIHAITFDYNQKHSREIACAEFIAKHAGVTSHKIVKLGPVLEGTSPLVSPDHKLEEYSGPYALPGGLEKTFVPMRNQLFLTIAANYAYVHGCGTVFTGVCEEDYGGYPDCRRAFLDALEEATTRGAFTGEDGAPGKFQIRSPLMYVSKRDTCHLARALCDGEAYNMLAFTHTGYNGEYPPVGGDHATLLRAKGFIEAGLPDPLVVRAVVNDELTHFPDTPNYDVDNDQVAECIASVSSFVDEVYAKYGRDRVPGTRYPR